MAHGYPGVGGMGTAGIDGCIPVSVLPCTCVLRINNYFVNT